MVKILKKTTKEISDELLKREGITHLDIKPYNNIKITTDQVERIITGPAIIIINQD